ncbi:MAG: hypothetical protein KGH88_01695 [Thaumarchaeota archaeon]|nr:hypothetical protein [Nitrososphaerota archaeon]
MKRSIVSLVVIVSVTAVGVFSALNYSKNPEFAGAGIGQAGASGMYVSLQVCNPSIMPVTIEGIEARLHGNTGDVGSLVIKGDTIRPFSVETLQGTLGFTDFNAMKTFVDASLNNETDTGLDATLLVREKMLGVIPYLYEKNYNLAEFSNVIFGNSRWSCNTKQDHASEIRQQLSLVQERMSAADLIYSGKIGMGNETQPENQPMP